MPNWVENDLRITADEKTMAAIRERILTEEGVLSFALLMPEELDNPAYRVKAGDARIEPEDTDTELNIFFLSPWSPPTAWFNKLRETFPDASFGMSSVDPLMEESWEDGESCP